ncbi:MAG: PPC domain-containing protein [Planctomycetaceae bacterium]
MNLTVGRRLDRMLIVILIMFFSGHRELFAQKSPGLGYVFPPALQAGKVHEVAIGGYDFTVDMQWFAHDEQITLQTDGVPGDYHIPPPPFWFGPRSGLPAMPIPREVRGQITVPAKTPEGLVRWQVANANGASETAVFYVSHSDELIERRSRDLPQRLDSLPVAVSGRLSRLTEVDRYEFISDRDQIVSLDLMARRLGVDMNPVLEVRDESGALVASYTDTLGQDAALHFFATVGKLYTVSVFDLDFRGDRAFVYRLELKTGPKIHATIPAHVQRGSKLELESFGVGLRSGMAKIESVKSTVTIPADPVITHFEHVLQTPAGDVSVRIPVSDLPEIIRGGNVETVLGSTGVTSLLGSASEVHRYSIAVMSGEQWSLDTESFGIGPVGDLALEVLDETGKVIAENDDGAVDSDPSLQFRAATAGNYTVVVKSVTAGTEASVYRLECVRQVPDFLLTVPQVVTLPLAGKSEITVQAVRFGGFDGEIVLGVNGLPEGVTATGEWRIPVGKSDAKVTLESAADAAVVAKLITIRGKTIVGATETSQAAMANAGGNLAPRSLSDRQVSKTMLSMTMVAPIEVLVVDKERQRDVHRGTTYLAELELVRKDGFAGEIRLEMTARQDRQRMGTRGGILTVRPDQSRALYPCFLPEWLPMDLTRRIIVHGVVAVPDPKGNVRYLTKPGNARITMIMEGALLKVSTENSDVVTPLGEIQAINVNVSRSPELPLPVRVELIVPDEAKGFISATPLMIEPGEHSGVLQVVSTTDEQLRGQWNLTVRATALQDEKWPVISESEIRVEYISTR